MAGQEPASAGEAGVGGSPPELPDIPTDGLILWLRADKGVELSGDVVSSWHDQSSNAYEAIQTGSNARPALVTDNEGHTFVVFDGVDDFMKLPAGFENFEAGLSLFTVARFDADACTSVLELSNGAEIDDVSFLEDHGPFLYEVSEATTYGDSFELGQLHSFGVVHRPTLAVEIRRNGMLTNEANVALPATVLRQQNFLGHSLYVDCPVLPGGIAEILLYDRAVTDFELLDIESYLNEHWGCCQ